MEIKEILLGLGMTHNEVEVYLTLLKSGSLSVNDIGEKSGLHRQVCYDALERLLEKGFVSYVIQNSKKYFQALNPQRLLDHLEQKKEAVQQILPELLKFTTFPHEETTIEVIKGKNVIRTILQDVINTLKENKGELLMLGVEESKFLEEDKIAIQQYQRDLKRFNLKEKLLASSKAKTYFEGEQSEYRLIDAQYFNPNPLYIYGNKVVQIIWGAPTHAVIINSKEIYDLHKKHFQMLWERAKKLRIN
ncbi:MAG TPA: helix-turn-helix domain-containing protein [Candidatus Nanoarchaeia archaeon]|nr:helix-turn-helix domain-containing protein [Candidatus Nanoarchaeia archaeon]